MSEASKTPFVPFLKGRQVSLRAFEDSDSRVFYQAVNDEETRQYLGGHLPMSQTQELEWVRSRQKAHTDSLTLSIILNRTKECIGNVSLFKINYVHRTAETGMLIASKRHRSKGFGPEAKALLLRYAFHTLGLNRIEAQVFATNVASKRSIEKSGYTYEGTLRQARYLKGQYTDVHVYSILRSEWEERR